MASPMRVTFCVLNLRMGGQVSSVTSLMQLVAARGHEVRLALPEGVPCPSKGSLAAFGRRPLGARAAAVWRMLRALPRGERDVVHLVVPTPAFAVAALVAPTTPRRVLVQYEGLPTAFDGEHLRAFRDDPLLLAPRLVLNHGAWARAARRTSCAHLATSPSLARWLRARGFEDVVEAPNVAQLSPEDGAPLPPGLVEADDLAVAYVGHCHRLKGVDDLVAAFALAAPRRPELRLVLALSPDGDRARVERRVEALPAMIRARVRVAGIVPVASLLRRVDALALPYRTLVTTTVYPSLLLEADALGCPVVVSDVEGLRDAFAPASERLAIVPPRDVRALADALVALPRRAAGRPVLSLPPVPERVDTVCDAYLRLVSRGT